MVKNSRGNAGKGSRRCPHCGEENAEVLRERLRPGEIRVAMTCMGCGEWIVFVPRAWPQRQTAGPGS